MHIKLTDETKERLREFAEKRKSMNAVVEYALVELFKVEEVDPQRERLLRRVLERKLTIPNGYSCRSFWLNLYMLGKKYPGFSAKDYWGAAIYRSAVEKTHGELLTEIQEEWSQELAKDGEHSAT
jgi:hypothetical protein